MSEKLESFGQSVFVIGLFVVLTEITGIETALPSGVALIVTGIVFLAIGTIRGERK